MKNLVKVTISGAKPITEDYFKYQILSVWHPDDVRLIVTRHGLPVGNQISWSTAVKLAQDGKDLVLRAQTQDSHGITICNEELKRIVSEHEKSEKFKGQMGL